MENNTMYQFDLPKQNRSIIKVIGVGGGGSNAVNHMYNFGIKDVEFVVCNTDVQALASSPVRTKLQIGANLTEGLGAGANPEVGMNAAKESRNEIRDLLVDNTKMLFITAGMGGGTGTGAAPVIAKIAKELDILTVGIVTAPFSFEGKRKMGTADKGIAEMKENCDTVLVITNDKLREIYGNLAIREAFAKADNILNTAAKSIAEIITVTSEVNVDFEDVKTVMKGSGPAVMGSASTGGENRAKRAVEEALSSPLLNNRDIRGARKILLSISYGEEQELTMDELAEITDYIEEQAGVEADTIFGQGVDVELGDQIRVTIVATGFNEGAQVKDYFERTVFDLESSRPKQTNLFQEEQKSRIASTPSQNNVPLEEIPVSSTPKNEEETVSEDDKVYFQIDGEYEVTEEEIDHTPSNSEDTNRIEEPDASELEYKKNRLIEQSKQRIAMLKEANNRNNYLNQSEIEDFKERLEVPAYKRKKVTLKKVQDSSESNISRYNLNDNDEGLGKNKFLHDNVD
ncbi:MAG: cell division protein FtsZ [Cyclobacteriaceae bacterium]